MATFRSMASKNVYWRMHEAHVGGDLIIKLPILAKQDLLLSWKVLLVASKLREGDIKHIQLSHMLGAKAHFAANMGILLLKAKGLFSYTWGCLILQQNLGSLLQKAKDSFSNTGGCLILQKIQKDFFKKLKAHLVVSHVKRLRPILQQILKTFRKALRVSICSSNITHYEISINRGILASIHPSATWSTTTSNFMIWHSATLIQFAATNRGQITS